MDPYAAIGTVGRPHRAVGDPTGPAPDDYEAVMDATNTASSLVAHWRFTSNLMERIGGYNASVGSGSESYGAALAGEGFGFNCAGVNWLSVTHAAALKPAVGTVQIWFKPASLHQAAVLSADAAGFSTGDFQIFVFADGTIRAHFQDASAQYSVITGSAYYTSGQTVHAAVTFDGTGFSFYLDGALVGTRTEYTGGFTGNTHDWNFGRSQTAGGDFNGIIDEIAIWNRVLSPLEIWSVATYEQIVAGPIPAIYLKLDETSGSTVADSSGNLRSGTITGTPSGYNVTALPNPVAPSNGGLNLGSAAWVSIPHAAADVALTAPSDWETEQSTSGYRFIAGATISVWFNPQALPTGSTKAVIFAKSHTATPGDAASYAETHPMAATPGSTVNGGSFEAFYDSAGAVHVECRSFRGRPCRVRTPNGAVSVGTAYHLVVQLSYDGVAAWLDGAKFEDGYANLLHVHGLASNMHGIVFANNYDWTLGKAAWGGQADIIVDEFAVYLHAPSADLTQSNINALAEIADTPAALAHHIWGALTVNESSYATINAAINDVNASGGGTVLIDPGTYAENITLKSNVRLKANGGTVQINGQVRTGLSLGSSIGAGSGDFETGDRTLTIANSRAVGDLIRVRGTWVDPTTATAARWDRRWNTTGESNAPGHPDAQLFEIETRTASSMTFVGEGSAFDFRNGSINILQAVNPVTPCSNVALEGDLRFSATNALSITLAKNMRIIGITSTNANLNAQSIDFISSIYVQLRNVTNVQANMTTPGSNNDGIYFQFGTSHAVCKDCLTQEGRHGFDNALHYNGAVAYGNEFHDCEWSNLVSRGTGGISNAWCTHMGMNTLFWNMHTNFGGPGNTGWRVDSRWCVCGNASENSGAIGCEDGAKEIYLRDLHIYRPTSWFEGFSGSVSVDNCRFENITHSATPTRTPHVNLSYGTGALVNTYSNVDTFSGSWTAV